MSLYIFLQKFGTFVIYFDFNKKSFFYIFSTLNWSKLDVFNHLTSFIEDLLKRTDLYNFGWI